MCSICKNKIKLIIPTESNISGKYTLIKIENCPNCDKIFIKNNTYSQVHISDINLTLSPNAFTNIPRELWEKSKDLKMMMATGLMSFKFKKGNHPNLNNSNT